MMTHLFRKLTDKLIRDLLVKEASRRVQKPPCMTHICGVPLHQLKNDQKLNENMQKDTATNK